MRPGVALSLSLLVFVACGDGGGGGEEPVGELVAGSAAPDGTGFVEVEVGQDVPLVPGSQGGFHVWINVRIKGAEGDLYLRRDARRVVDDELVLRGLRQYIEVPDTAMDGWWQAPDAAPAFMCPSPLGLKVYDEEIYYEVRLVDNDDVVLAEDTIILTPRCPTGDARNFCVEICSG